MRTALLAVLFAVAALAFGMGAIVAFTTNDENGRADPVEVHATVTASSRGGRGSAASAQFRTDEGVEGTISGSADVGEHITVYRYGSGEYGWKARPGAEPLWFAVGAGVLSLSMVVIGADQVRRSMRRSRRHRSR
ncbi:hypothetical protein [Brachybacterium sp. ACRRE]|uniref:hypothetical protein n=1 Tax=Brachybacterium sp. ACRRE TaxID=2918184 RepID=UPI001EF1F57A|nr:hypothetical protein [Brachybacterium sp. ACRRE]MCG7307926.1 hypothetical protein [Brachybacterium sp. ACRRE]